MGPRLVTEVERTLATDGRLGWTVYTDLLKKSAAPSAEVVARTVRVNSVER
ncbi:hypothetical protein [Kribbella ginsengisoli]|uniref:Uncharacterized protein n=1 Tax=Kribbella ginsengisoli TaxID=363865 RepID=A0ABP6YCE7_9ACTN